MRESNECPFIKEGLHNKWCNNQYSQSLRYWRSRFGKIYFIFWIVWGVTPTWKTMITALWFEASCVPYIYLKHVSISISNSNVSLWFAITEWWTSTAHNVELTRRARSSIRCDNICQWISRLFNVELRISWTASSISHIPLVWHGLYNISN